MVEELVEVLLSRLVELLEITLDEFNDVILLLLVKQLADILLLDVDLVEILGHAVPEQAVCGHLVDVRGVEGASFLEHA